MAIDKERKQELLAQYTDLLQRSEAIILTDYQGLNVAQMTQLRNSVREAEGVYYVTKNTLIRLTLQNADMAVPDEWVEGATAVGFCFSNVPGVAKALKDFAKETEILKIKGGLLGDKQIGEKRINALAELPPTDVLQAQMLGTLIGPMSGLVGALNGLMSGLVGVLDARREQLGEPEAA